MARIVYTGLVSSINGSIGGTTFQRNAYGFTIKKKPNIVNPNRVLQQARKATLQNVSQAWATLTGAQRSNWASYATSYPVPSRLNPSAYLSGQALWLRTNLLRLQYGAARLDTITSTLQDTLSLGSIGLVNSGGHLTYSDATTSALGNMVELIYLSQSVKVSQLYDRSRTRFIGMMNINGTHSIDLAAAYTSIFGLLPNGGTYVFLKRVYLNTTNGQVIAYPPTSQIVV